MARTLLDLAKSLERRATGISNIGNASKKRKIIAVLKYVVPITPVDTSEALSNWQLGIGAPPIRARGAFFVGKHGSTAEASIANTINYAISQLAEVEAGTPVWISNLVPYIGKLNEGSSSQNPGGFVEAARLIARITP